MPIIEANLFRWSDGAEPRMPIVYGHSVQLQQGLIILEIFC